jgi:ABC-type multidrug transport system fused ATPase/permease subunit
MNSIERVDEWISELTSEKEWNIDNVSKDWPKTGKFEAKNVTYRYREGLPNVIKGIDFSIENHEKIGVVGRTGSGKSTLTLGLLRILEISEES